MRELHSSLKSGEMVFFYDMSSPISMDIKPREFYYEVLNNGNNYVLFGIGVDATPYTDDDIYPLIDTEKDKNIGWIKSK